MEIILFQPPTWQPVVIHSREEEAARLASGYRRERPTIAVSRNQKTTAEDEIKIEGKRGLKKKATIEKIGAEIPATVIKINKLTIGELSDKIPGVGTVTAKKIKDNRPFKTVEDLYAVTDRIKWANLWIDYEE